jgi:hypothetical protein
MAILHLRRSGAKGHKALALTGGSGAKQHDVID